MNAVTMSFTWANVCPLLFFLIVGIGGEEEIHSGQRIIHGTTTNIRNYPFFGLLTKKTFVDSYPLKINCGSSLISKRFLLTAFHCVENELDAKQWVVIMGIKSRCYHDGSGTVVDLAQIYAPRGSFMETMQPIEFKNYDIALLETERPVDGFEPINLPTEPQRHGDSGKIIGFGLTGMGQEDGNGGYFACELQEGVEVIQDLERCDIPQGISRGVFCAEDPTKNDVTACRGDSGGPWISMKNQIPTILGVSSFGDRDCRAFFDVYTDIYAHIHWISAVLRTEDMLLDNIDIRW